MKKYVMTLDDAYKFYIDAKGLSSFGIFCDMLKSTGWIIL